MPTLTDNERRIFDGRQSGCALLDMNQREIIAATTGIIFKVSVICGCQLPTHEPHINALEAEFSNFLIDYGFGSMTVEEVLTAFRMNAAGKLSKHIEIYGAIFNIDYAAKVLHLYRDERYRLDSKLSERHRAIEADKILNQEADKRRRKVKEQFKNFLIGGIPLELSDCYMQLEADGAFHDRHFDDRFFEDDQRGFKGNPLHSLTDWGERMNRRFEAGKKAVMVLFNAMKNTGKLEIYDDQLNLIHTGFALPEEKEVPPMDEF